MSDLLSPLLPKIPLSRYPDLSLPWIHFGRITGTHVKPYNGHTWKLNAGLFHQPYFPRLCLSPLPALNFT
jgi:hypothetical protein